MNVQRNTVFCLIAAVILMGFASVVLAGQAAVPVTVSVGKGTILTLKEPSKRVSIASPDIAELNLLTPTELLINGKKIGNTSLIIWNVQGKTTFFDVMVTADISQLQGQLKEIAPNDNIRADMAGDTIILSGHAKNQQTIDKAVKLAQAHAVASSIRTTTSYEGGVAKETSESSGKVINQIIMDEAQQVMLEVKVAQVNKSRLKELGMNTSIQGFFDNNNLNGGVGFPDIFNIPNFAPQAFLLHFPSHIQTFLKILETNGAGEILAEPNLIVRSGERGNFHVGTQYPVQTVTGTGANATVGFYYIPIGIKLNFAPEVLETGVIRLRSDDYKGIRDEKSNEMQPLAEVSGIVDFVKTALIAAPIIDTRRITTSVDLHDGESLILAGLLSNEMKKNIQKIPLIGDIPILGALFRNTSTDVQEKELVFFITPSLVKPQAPGTAKPALPTLTPEEKREFDWIPMSMPHKGYEAN